MVKTEGLVGSIDQPQGFTCSRCVGTKPAVRVTLVVWSGDLDLELDVNPLLESIYEYRRPPEHLQTDSAPPKKRGKLSSALCSWQFCARSFVPPKAGHPDGQGHGGGGSFGFLCFFVGLVGSPTKPLKVFDVFG